MLTAINLQTSVQSIHRRGRTWTRPGAKHIGLPRFGLGFIINRLLSKYKTANERLLRACHLSLLWKENQNNVCPMPRAMPPTPTLTFAPTARYHHFYSSISSSSWSGVVIASSVQVQKACEACAHKISCRLTCSWIYHSYMFVFILDISLSISSTLCPDLDFGRGVSELCRALCGRTHTWLINWPKKAQLSRTAT